MTVGLQLGSHLPNCVNDKLKIGALASTLVNVLGASKVHVLCGML